MDASSILILSTTVVLILLAFSYRILSGIGNDKLMKTTDAILIGIICLSCIPCIVLPSVMMIQEQCPIFSTITLFIGIWIALISLTMKIAAKHRKPFEL